MTIHIKVWDLPLRVFHWALAFSFLGAFATGELGGNLMYWHGVIGTFILGLIIFRVIWGIIGSQHSRFLSFFPTPRKVISYFKGEWQAHGHNPLGAISVLLLLSLVAAQVGTGLFANDDIAFEAPLFRLVDKEVSDSLSALHSTLFYVLAGLVVLHMVAVGFYFLFKKTNLVTPMITGKKRVEKGFEVPVAKPGNQAKPRHFIFALVLSTVLTWAIHTGLQYLQEPTKPPPQVATPGW